MDVNTLLSEVLAADAVVLKMTLGCIFGLCLGLTGVGGGVLLIPMLQVFCGMAPVLAVGTASTISAMVKVNASIAHVRSRNVSWRQVMMLFVGAVPVTILVTQAVVFFNQHPVYGELTQSVVTMLVASVMIGSLASVLRKYLSNKKEVTVASNIKPSKRKTIISGAFCGSVLGSTGVGGGVLLLPILNNVLNLDIKKSVGSSVVLALFLSTIAALGYAKGGQSDVITAIWFLVGSFVGVPVSSMLMKKMSDNMVYLVTLIVILVSIMMYFQTL
jgi:uncharacterized membrane protein YfcA